jgi:hypothetical protein
VNPDSVIAKFPVAPDKSNMPTADAIEASIARVLDAEAAAVDAVARARDVALAIAEQAREEVRRLGFRTDRRLHAVRAAFEARAAGEVATLAAETSALDAIHELTLEEIGRVDSAVNATAAAMTGGPH